MTKEKLVIQLAKCYNTKNTDHIKNCLHNNITYESQWVYKPMVGKEVVFEYITAKMETVKNSNNIVKAQLAYYSSSQIPCIIMEQNKDLDNGLFMITVKDNLIYRIDICLAPNWREADGTGIYPE